MRDGRARPARTLTNADSRFALVVSRFNEDVTDGLLEGAREALSENGASGDCVEIFRVPGAWELIGAAQRAVDTGRYSAIITLGCIIRGETPHFEYLSGATARGLSEVARLAAIPVTFGVLTTDTPEQARARATPDPGNKGREAALAAIEMLELYGRLSHGLESA